MMSQCDYAFQENMPFARQPLKSMYVGWRLFTTLAHVPFWVLYYALLPRSRRPRESWSIKQIVAVNFTRRIYKVTELAGVTFGTRNPEKECSNRCLRETRFEWVDPLPEELRTGIVVDDQVPFKRVGAFVWPKERPPEIPRCNEHSPDSKPSDHSQTNLVSDDREANARIPVIGIFLHGGGYVHMSAHERCQTSKIPRRLMKDKAFTEIHAVEYRLLQHAPFPAAVQDAAAVYAHIVRRHQRPPHSPKPGTEDSAVSNSDVSSTAEGNDSDRPKTGSLTPSYFVTKSRYDRENDEVRTRVEQAVRTTHCKIILIGDSAGGNLVLALARWIRDEGVLPPPAGLLLLSPSCDPSHAFPDTPHSYVPRPHASTDYLVDTPEPRALLQRTFLGHNPLETMHSPYVSPASTRVLRAFYGDSFAQSVEDLTIARLDTRVLRHLRTLESAPATPLPDAAPVERSPTSLAHPVLASPRGLSLFSGFPQVCVVLGDAERLEREVMKLVGAMERDEVRVKTVWVEDGVHDVLMMGWWDEKVRDSVWNSIEAWVAQV